MIKLNFRADHVSARVSKIKICSLDAKQLMLIWLNGAFGIGKTQTAFELHSRIPGSFVFDPEQIGFLLRKIVPSEVCVGDFQNHRIWREYTCQGLQYIAQNFAGAIIVPMTVVDPLYYDQTVGALRYGGLQVHHFTLLASRDTILGRLPVNWIAA
jgi:hypothetical protein